MVQLVPASPVRGRRAAAATADQLATQAAMEVFARGGNAVDAAIAANAAMTVVAPHLCGLGGDNQHKRAGKCRDRSGNCDAHRYPADHKASLAP